MATIPAFLVRWPLLVLAWRHGMVWRRRLLSNLALYIAGPMVFMYGLSKAFNLDAQLPYIVPGFMVNTAVVGAFISCTYGTLERFYASRYEGWMAATLRVCDLVGAEAVFQAFKGSLLSTGIWLAGLILGLGFHPLAWLFSLPVIVLCSVSSALLGYAVAALAKTYDDLALTEPLLTGVMVFSGVFVAVGIYPEPLQWAVMFLPVYHGIELIRPFFMGGDFALGAVAFHLAALLAQALVFGWLAVKAFERRLVQ